MGVRGLQKFMKDECKNGFEYVSLPETVQLYRCKTGENPVIFYEMPSCVMDQAEKSLNPLEILICGGLKKFKKNLEIFINNFFELGVNLKVVSDGYRRSYKHLLWIERLNRLVELLEKLYSGEKAFYIDILNLRSSVLSFYLVANLTFQTTDKCEYIRGINRGVEYIIRHMKKSNCFAVLTNDSSFVFAEGAEYCLSSKDLNLDIMTTFKYNRNNLAKHFNISTSQLPLFGSLLLYDFSGCPAFFKKPMTSKKVVFYKMSQLVKKLPSGEEILQKKISDCQKFLPLDKEDLTKWIECLKFFCGCSESDTSLGTSNETWEEILSVAEKRHTRGVITIIYEVLSQHRVYLHPGFSNTLKPMPGKALLPLRKQLYGILFSEYPCGEISVTEHCYDYCEEIKRVKYVCRIVTFQRVEHPGLLKMWSQLPSENLQEEKRRIFYHALDKKLNPDDLKDIEEELLFPFLATFYLFWKSEIKLQEFEIKILLIQAILVNNLSEEEIAKYSLDIADIEVDAIDLSSWFIETVNHLNYLYFACGQPFCLHKMNLVNFFDGKILQHVYKNEKHEQRGTKSVQAWSAEVWEKFTFLKNKLYQIGSELYKKEFF